MWKSFDATPCITTTSKSCLPFSKNDEWINPFNDCGKMFGSICGTIFWCHANCNNNIWFVNEYKGMWLFAFVINFFTPQWELHHVCVGLFEVNDTIGARLIKQMKTLLKRFKVTSKILWFIKDEGTNLRTMTATLKSLVMSSIETRCAFWWDLLWACKE